MGREANTATHPRTGTGLDSSGKAGADSRMEGSRAVPALCPQRGVVLFPRHCLPENILLEPALPCVRPTPWGENPKAHKPPFFGFGYAAQHGGS